MERDVDKDYLTQVYYTDHYAGHDATDAAKRFSQLIMKSMGNGRIVMPPWGTTPS